MKHTSRLRVLSVIACLALVAAACGSEGTTTTTTAAPGEGSTSTTSGESTATTEDTSVDACADEPAQGGTLVVTHSREPQTLNMAISVDNAGIVAVGGVYSGLITLDENAEPIPDLAESWEVSDDGLTYTFHLRDDVTWHDGEPFTSADVKYTVEEVSSELHPRSRVTFSHLESLETPDDHTVVFNLSAPYAPFIKAFVVSEVAILPEHLYEGTDPLENEVNFAPVGTGPFMFDSWEAGQSIRVVRNPNYWKPCQPYLDAIVMQVIPDASSRVSAFVNGDIDYLQGLVLPRDQVPVIRQVDGVQEWGMSGYPVQQIATFNTKREPLDDPAVRRAIAAAVDTQDVATKVFFDLGVPSTASFPVGLTKFHNPNVDWPEYDPEAAMTMLDDLGFTEGADGYRFDVAVVAQSELDLNGAQLLANNLQAVGINATVEQFDASVRTQRISTDYDFGIEIVTLTSNGDPALGIARLYTTSSIQPGVNYLNSSQYSNPAVDDLFDEGASATTEQGRQDAYFEVQEILAGDLPQFPLVDFQQTDFAQPYVCGTYQTPFFYYRYDVMCVTNS